MNLKIAPFRLGSILLICCVPIAVVAVLVVAMPVAFFLVPVPVSIIPIAAFPIVVERVPVHVVSVPDGPMPLLIGLVSRKQ